MKILVNYANDKYKGAQRLNTWTGKHIAKFDKIYSFGPDDIDDGYRKQHSDILDNPRGNGLWLWKPYFIKRVLDGCNEGDYVFYVDSGAFFIRNADVIVRSFREGENIWVSDNPLLESCFTKSVCFEALDCEGKKYSGTNQIQATYVFFRCCGESRAFVNEWLSFCERPELMEPAGSLNISQGVGSGFVAHREDQSILSLLCKKQGIEPHRDPSQRGKWPETFYNPHYAYKVPVHGDTYKSFVFLHKSAKAGVKDIVKTLLINMRSVYRYRKGRRHGE